MKTRRNRKSGQAMVEYIIIVVIVAIAALVIFGFFGDTIRRQVGRAVDEMGGESGGVEEGSSLRYLQDNE